MTCSIAQPAPAAYREPAPRQSDREIVLLDAGQAQAREQGGARPSVHALKDNIHCCRPERLFFTAASRGHQEDRLRDRHDARDWNNAAITFAASFYRAIGFGRSIKEAFDQGIAALLLDGSVADKTPVLLSGKNTAADKVFLINP
jgi:hypothetical protein